MIHNADCLDVLKATPDNSVDLIVTDPPYGMSFMGKDWDKAVPYVEIWKECLRVLKDGAFAFVMCIPRQDCLAHMVVNLSEAGFETGFTSMYWAYASGFPKAGNIGKQVDRRLGVEREIVGRWKGTYPDNPDSGGEQQTKGIWTAERGNDFLNLTAPATDQAKALDGSYAGFQPKPAVEVILCVMKPLSKKTYVEQALDNQKGITWLDDCRVPYESDGDRSMRHLGKPRRDDNVIYGKANTVINESSQQGRFPANLLCSDDVLNDGRVTKGHIGGNKLGSHYDRLGNTLSKVKFGEATQSHDSGSFSRYFDLDKWMNKTFPFFITPKASKREKNKGCEGLPVKAKPLMGEFADNPGRVTPKASATPRANHHPTCKPLKLMCYLITLGSRQQDVIVDPFMGSGTTGVACKMLNREFIGMEINEDYFKIAEARIGV